MPALLVAAAWGVGWFLPASHVAANQAAYRSDAEDVWNLVSDFERYPLWRPGINEVERLPDRDGNPVWVERGTTGDLTYEVTAWEPPWRLVTRVADPRLPFGGTWTYRIDPRGEGCTLTLIENGEIRHPLFRFMTRFFFGYYGGIDGYQRALAAELGEPPRVERVTDAP